MNETGQGFSASDCCNGLGGGAYMQTNGSCVSCPQSKFVFVLLHNKDIVTTLILLSCLALMSGHG